MRVIRATRVLVPVMSVLAVNGIHGRSAGNRVQGDWGALRGISTETLPDRRPAQTPTAIEIARTA